MSFQIVTIVAGPTDPRSFLHPIFALQLRQINQQYQFVDSSKVEESTVVDDSIDPPRINQQVEPYIAAYVDEVAEIADEFLRAISSVGGRAGQGTRFFELHVDENYFALVLSAIAGADITILNSAANLRTLTELRAMSADMLLRWVCGSYTDL